MEEYFNSIRFQEEIDQAKRQSWIALAAGIAIVLFLPMLLTRPGFTFFDFTDTGQIGDTIGGITAPFIGLVGAYLVYLSFRAQLSANRLQFKALMDELKVRKREATTQRREILKVDQERTFTHLYRLLEDMELRWERFSPNDKENYGELLLNSIDHLKRSTSHSLIPSKIAKHLRKIQQLTYIINSFNEIYRRINIKEKLLEADRKFLLARISFFYSSSLSELQYPIDEMTEAGLNKVVGNVSIKWLFMLKNELERMKEIGNQLQSND